MTIFPFLQIARSTGAKYGDVIRLAETYSELWAVEDLKKHRILSNRIRQLVFDAVIDEEIRRRENSK